MKQSPQHHNRRAAAVTLPEMMVAVAITVMMLLITGSVFKHSTEASGKAMAYMDVMTQLRALTEQLDRDFQGLRPDLPLVITNEWADINGYISREDSITFFSSGTFQVLTRNLATDPMTLDGNLVRITYAQSDDRRLTPVHEENPDLPERRFLTRRQKILTPDTGTWMQTPSPAGSDWVGWDLQFYDHAAIEIADTAAWQNMIDTEFSDIFFDEDDRTVASWLRRPNVASMNGYVPSIPFARPYYSGEEGVQRMYFLPDVYDLRIDILWSWDTVWRPGDSGGIDPNPLSANNDYADIDLCYWNCPDVSNTLPFRQPNSDWWWVNMDTWTQTFGQDLWPAALRFTFTLYDKNRRHYPDGLTFNYIVKIPKKE